MRILFLLTFFIVFAASAQEVGFSFDQTLLSDDGSYLASSNGSIDVSGISLNGSNQFIEIPAEAMNPGVGDFSIEIRFTVRDITKNSTLISKGFEGLTVMPYKLDIIAGGSLKFAVHNKSQVNSTVSVSSGQIIEEGGSYTVTLQRRDTRISLFLDNSFLVGVKSTDGVTLNLENTVSTYLGSDSRRSNFADVFIDDIRYYPYATLIDEVPYIFMGPGVVSDTSGTYDSGSPGAAQTQFNPGDIVRITYPILNDGGEGPKDVVAVLNIDGPGDTADFSTPLYDSNVENENRVLLSLAPGVTEYISFDWRVPSSSEAGFYRLSASVRDNDVFDDVLDHRYDDGIFDFEVGILHRVPFYNQGPSNWCGFSTTAMIAGFHGAFIKPWELAALFDASLHEGLPSPSVAGWWWRFDGDVGIANDIKSIYGYDYESIYHNVPILEKDWAEMRNFIEAGIASSPLSLSVGAVSGVADDSEIDGHIVCVAGMNDNGIIINDPSKALYTRFINPILAGNDSSSPFYVDEENEGINVFIPWATLSELHAIAGRMLLFRFTAPQFITERTLSVRPLYKNIYFHRLGDALQASPLRFDGKTYDSGYEIVAVPPDANIPNQSSMVQDLTIMLSNSGSTISTARVVAKVMTGISSKIIFDEDVTINASSSSNINLADNGETPFVGVEPGPAELNVEVYLNDILQDYMSLQFELHDFTVEYSKFDSVNGNSVQTISYGATIPLEAIESPVILTAGQRQVLDGFTGSGSAPSGIGAQIPEFIITEDSSITCNWIPEYHLTVNSTAGGQATGSGWFIADSYAPLIGIADEGYRFSDWIGAGVSDSNLSSTDVFMDQERVISANFLVNSTDGYNEMISGFGGETDINLIGPDEDFDGDSKSNFYEYAFVLDPTSPIDTADVTLATHESGENMYGRLTFKARSDDAELTYIAHVSGDLSDWTPVTISYGDGAWSSSNESIVAVESATNHGDGTWTLDLEDRAPVTSGSPRFIKLEADSPY